MPDVGDFPIQVRQLVEVPISDPVNKPEDTSRGLKLT
jgi:hypothetical protein